MFPISEILPTKSQNPSTSESKTEEPETKSLVLETKKSPQSEVKKLPKFENLEEVLPESAPKSTETLPKPKKKRRKRHR